MWNKKKQINRKHTNNEINSFLENEINHNVTSNKENVKNNKIQV